MIELVVTILERFGFPILICLWFMVRLEKRIDGFTGAIHKLVVTNKLLVRALDAQALDHEEEEEEDS